jgi:putative flippase GtrA
MHTAELSAPLYASEQEYQPARSSRLERRPSNALFGQLLRFGVVGCLNTLLDLLALNVLLWLRPTHNVGMLLIDNSIAYSFGAVNSFLFNKYWTFRCPGRARRREVVRFALTTLAGVLATICSCG